MKRARRPLEAPGGTLRRRRGKGPLLYRTPFPEADKLGRHSMHLYPTAATKSLQTLLSPHACTGDIVTEGRSSGGVPRAPLLKKPRPVCPKAEPIGCVRKNVGGVRGEEDESRELEREPSEAPPIPPNPTRLPPGRRGRECAGAIAYFLPWRKPWPSPKP